MNKKIGYFIDKVSEDSFYENLLIGLPKALEKLPHVSNKNLKRFPPITKYEIFAWEQKHSLSIPKEFRDLYLSCNGLLYTYNFTYEPTNRENEELRRLIGKIEVNPIGSLKLLKGFEIKPMSKIHYDGFIYRLDLSPDSKVFDISNCEYYHVVLVYPDAKTSPTIWVYDLKTFYFVANDLITYLRMAITHIGVPGWQFIFSPLGLPGKSREMLNILAPGVLYEDKELVNPQEDDKFRNKLDPYIFNEIEIREKISATSVAPSVTKSSVSLPTERKKSVQRGSSKKRIIR